MAKKSKGRGSGRGQTPIKGFRPGKAPAHLKKQRAKSQLGPDASWAQKQAVDAVAGRSPQEVEAMVSRWTLGALIGAVVLGVVGAVLYMWSLAAGIVVHMVALGVLFLVYRLRKYGQGLVEMAESMR